ncbi:MAG: hypothetical protein ACYDA5_00790 [Vulcanimicrobiaceae bacterium]
MRPHHALKLSALGALLLVAACAAHTSAAPAPKDQPTLAPLRSCAERVVYIDGAEVVVEANLDGSLDSATVIRASDAAARRKALAVVVKAYGRPHPDTRVVTRPWKLGLVQQTDPCGRPIFAASPSPSPGRPRVVSTP